MNRAFSQVEVERGPWRAAGTATGTPQLPAALASSMRRGEQPRDREFDRFLPKRLRALSDRYWTPLAVVACAARWLDELGVRTVVDVGSGTGKFCIAGAMMTRCHFLGVEQRPHLVAASQVMAKLYGVQDRVCFLHETFGEHVPPAADAYYFFNPYGENRFGSESWLDGSVELSEERFFRDVASTRHWLSVAPPRTYVLTYNGLGGRLPGCYVPVRTARGLPCALQLWRKLDRS
jgi:hypothetical protein